MISISSRAADMVREFATATPEAEGKNLRIFIRGVGCSGFAYGFAFDDRHEDDTVVTSSDITVIVDPQSAPHLEGAAIDFIDDQRGRGFVVDNPNVPESSCGSGGCSGCE